MFGIKLIQFANASQFKSAPYVPVACCDVTTKDILTLAASGLYKKDGINYHRVGEGTMNNGNS